MHIMNDMRDTGIIGVGKYVPDRILTNKELEKLVDTSDEWILSRTGIRQRHIAAPEQATSDLAYHASLRALADAGITGEQIELIIVATITPDHLFPSTACILQHKLGATKAAAFDLSAACSGFVYALSIAHRFVQSGMYQNVLVVGADCLSKITDYTDRNTCVLFGDGAGAAVVGAVEQGRGFQSFDLGSEGQGADFLKVDGGGSRFPTSLDSLTRKKHYITMNGREVYKFAVRVMSSATDSVLHKARFTKEDIDLFVPHQANIRIIESAMEKLKLPQHKVVINVQKYANTSAASIGIALAEAAEQNRLKPGDKVVLVGFGSGLTWAGALFIW